MVERSPVFFGWVVLVAGTFGIMMTTPGQTVGVSVFLDRIIADLGLSRSGISLLYTIGTLAGSLALPLVGRFIDRRGPRLSVVLISAGFALACVWMGMVRGVLTLLVGFVLIRGLGQGALSLVSMHVINIWFVRRRGLAVGLAGLGVAAAFAVFPIGIEALIERVGWRVAYPALGGLVALAMLPVGGGLFRSHPERYGLVPDGRVWTPKPGHPPELDYPLGEAQRTLTFWLYATGGFLTAALGTGLIFHHFSIMAQNGIGRGTAATMFLGYGAILAGANLVTGFLMDRVPPRFLLAGSLGLMGGALLLAPRVSSPELVLVYGAMLGGMQGTGQAIQGSVYAYYFGRRHIGAIRGFATAVAVAGTSTGPLLLALGFDASGSYGPVLALAAFPPLVLAVASPFLRLVRDGGVA